MGEDVANQEVPLTAALIQDMPDAVREGGMSRWIRPIHRLIFRLKHGKSPAAYLAAWRAGATVFDQRDIDEIYPQNVIRWAKKLCR